MSLCVCVVFGMRLYICVYLLVVVYPGVCVLAYLCRWVCFSVCCLSLRVCVRGCVRVRLCVCIFFSVSMCVLVSDCLCVYLGAGIFLCVCV